ncbi:MAG: acyl-CoA carboxylase subunit beta [Euryarchaeota archaeon]|nr:acyl-CoA carboxylase subunit beta [Euryarchaeota archaeon]
MVRIAPTSQTQQKVPPAEHDVERLEEIRELHRLAELGGGHERITAQHEKGKLTARERLEMLLDPGTFVEMDKFVQHRASLFGMADKKILGDGVVTGYGKINGRLVYVYAQDFTVLGGSLGEMCAEKITKVQDLALQNGAPLVGLNDSGGARIQEGVAALAGYGDIFYRNVQASGVIPQLSAIMGPCAGGAVYSPAITDFIFMTRGTGHMFVTGPEVVETVTGESCTFDELGGADMHASVSGVCHFTADSEEETLYKIKRLLSYLPANNAEDPPYVATTDDPTRIDEVLDTIVPADTKRPYDMRDVVDRIVDRGTFYEVHEDYATNLIVGLARLDGHVIGIVGNQPKVLAGVLDSDASEKGARFIRFCDAFNIPIVSFVDVPGFMPGLKEERGGIIRNGAKLLYAYCEATVPKLTVVTRKAYGGAYIVMCSKHLRSDYNLAWPGTEIAVLGPEAAVKIVYRKEIQQADDPEAMRIELEEEFRRRFATPMAAAERGFLDDIIEPRETRPRLVSALQTLIGKRQARPSRKHGNIPL